MRTSVLRITVIVMAVVAGAGVVSTAAPLDTVFTYQGRLTSSGSPANGQYDFELKLYDDPAAGSQVGSTVNLEDQQVTNGLFTVQPDFGSGIFTGNALWLEIGVRPGADTGPYTTLSPRQKVTAAPYALYALNAAGGGLALPYSGLATSTGTAFAVTNTGGGGSAWFETMGTAAAPTVTVQSNGGAAALLSRTVGSGGNAGSFEISNPTNLATALFAATSGTGSAGRFQIANPDSAAVALYSITNGLGRAGYFQITSPDSAAAAIEAITAGIGPAGRFRQRIQVDGLVESTADGFKFPDGTTQTTAALSLALPYSGTVSTAGNAFSVINNGSGGAGYFETFAGGDALSAIIALGHGAGPAVYGYNNGGGRAARFDQAKADSAADALSATTAGTGVAGRFAVSNAASSSPALHASTSGTGPAGYFAQRILVDGLLESTSGGFKFPDGTIQTTADAGPKLPYSGSVTTDNVAFQVVNHGTGYAGLFGISSAENGAAALRADTQGTGSAGQFTANADSPANALWALSLGSGTAGLFTTVNADNSNPALMAYTLGTGYAARFSNDNASSSAAALWASTSGTGPAGEFLNRIKVHGLVESTADGVKFPDGTIQTTADRRNALDADDGYPSNVVLVDATGKVGIGAGTGRTTVLDQHQDNAVSPMSPPVAWQSFTCGLDGALAKVDLRADPGGQVIVHTGEGIGGAVLASGWATPVPPPEYGWVEVYLDPWVPAGATTVLTIEYDSPVMNWFGADGDPYPAGQGGTLPPGYDYAFRTYMNTEATVPVLTANTDNRVGIGTDTPSTTLHLKTSLDEEAAIRLETARLTGTPDIATREPTVVTETGTGEAWVNPQAALGSDDAWASVHVFSGPAGASTNSRGLELTNLGFNIPVDAVVKRLDVAIEGHFSSTSPYHEGRDLEVLLDVQPTGDGGLRPKEDISLPEDSDSTTPRTLTWTPTWMGETANSAGFGVRLTAKLRVRWCEHAGCHCAVFLGCDCWDGYCSGWTTPSTLEAEGTMYIDSVSVTLTYYTPENSAMPATYAIGVPLSSADLAIGPGETPSNSSIVISPSGSVGIGRQATANKLEVEGNASKATAGNWEANSDARIKTDIETIRGALDKLDEVRLVSFRYNDEYRKAHPSVENHRYVNIVAQEFAEVFPESVKPSGEKLPDGGDEILQADPYPLTIYTAAAVQELHQAVKEKDAEIAVLRKRLERLENLVHRLANKDEGGTR